MQKDIILFGGLVGIIGNIPKEILAWGLYFLGWIKYTFDHICAGIYVSLVYLHEPLGVLLGITVDFVQAGIFGVSILYILKKTGVEHHWVLKGFALGFGMFLICFGALRLMMSPKIIISTPLENLLYLPPNVLFALTTPWFIKRSQILKNKW